jgi:hypothetical protein
MKGDILITKTVADIRYVVISGILFPLTHTHTMSKMETKLNQFEPEFYLDNQCKPHTYFRWNPHHSLYNLSSITVFFLVYISKPTCYRMIHRGQRLTPSTTNKKHNWPNVNVCFV